MAAKRAQARVILRGVRLSYPYLIEPREKMDGSGEEYSVSIIIPDGGFKPEGIKHQQTDVQALQKQINGLAKEAFGAKALAQMKAGTLRNPLHNGDDERPEDPAYAGCHFINARADVRYPPQVIDRDGDFVISEAACYPGVYANVSLSLYSYDNVSKGIGAGIRNVRIWGEGDRLDGGLSADDELMEEDEIE